jgi:integrase
MASRFAAEQVTCAQRSDLENGMLTVHHTKSYKVRRVPVPPELMRELHGRVGRLVYFSSSGQFNNRVRILSRIWRFHAHQCLHTFACRWAERGGNLAALQQVLGHSSIVTTQRYARLSDAAVRAEAERLAGQ